MNRRTKHGKESRLLKMKLKQELASAKRVIKEEGKNLTDAIKYLKEIKQINIDNAGKLGVVLTSKNFKDTGWDDEIKRLTNEYREQIRANIAEAEAARKKQEVIDRMMKDEPPPGGWDNFGQLEPYEKEVSSKWGGKRKTRRKRKTKKRRKKKTRKTRKKRRGKKKTKRRR